MSDFIDGTTQKTERDKFFKNKAFLLEDLADKGDMDSLNKEFKLFKELTRDEKRIFFNNHREINFNELSTICKINNSMNKVDALNIDSLQNLVNAYGELETVELESSYLRESKRQKIAERKNYININLNKVSQRVVKDTLIDLYYLAENNEMERFYDLKNEYNFLIGSVYTSNYFFDTFFSKVEGIEKSLGLNSSFEDLFRNVFDVVNKAHKCFTDNSYSDGINHLNHADEFIENNNLVEFHHVLTDYKNDLVKHCVSVHLSAGFFCAEKRDEQGMNYELDKAKLLMNYVGDDNRKDIEIIERVCYKESLPWIVDEFQNEALKQNPDSTRFKKLSSDFRRYSNNLKLNSFNDFLFAKKYEQKLSDIGEQFGDHLKKYI
jgi:hypothetical protein